MNRQEDDPNDVLPVKPGSVVLDLALALVYTGIYLVNRSPKTRSSK